MLRTFCHSKIHRATVTSVDLHYEGSITVDIELLNKADIKPYEQVHVFDVNNGNRFITYAIPGEAGSGTIQVNGAAAHLSSAGDLVIIVSYCELEEIEIENFKPKVVYVDSSNRAVELERAL